jgi:voltage-gated potassium channel
VHASWLYVTSNVIWAIFGVELLAKLIVSGHPFRFLRRTLAVGAVPGPAGPPGAAGGACLARRARVAGQPRGRVVLPCRRHGEGTPNRAPAISAHAATAVVVFGGGQLLFVLERGREGALTSLGDALWWAANLGISASLVYQPVTLAGRLLAIVLSAYSIVVFASLAATVGAFFIESRQERASTEGQAD